MYRILNHYKLQLRTQIVVHYSANFIPNRKSFKMAARLNKRIVSGENVKAITSIEVIDTSCLNNLVI